MASSGTASGGTHQLILSTDHLFSEACFILLASDFFCRALSESREEERHKPRASKATETQTSIISTKPAAMLLPSPVSDGREGRGTGRFVGGSSSLTE